MTEDTIFGFSIQEWAKVFQVSHTPLVLRLLYFSDLAELAQKGSTSFLLSLLINAPKPPVSAESSYNEDLCKNLIVFIVANSCSCCKLLFKIQGSFNVVRPQFKTQLRLFYKGW